ncbi:MAG: sensor histidine kinase [Gloeotrichia echinulata GP01]
MSNPASEHLQQNSQKILQIWEVRTRDKIDGLIQHSSLVLRDSLPEYLNQLVDELSTSIDRTDERIADDKAENTRIFKLHGSERASFADYTLNQLTIEYQILRQIIFEVLEEEAPLGVRERDIIITSIERGVNDAAAQFSQTLRDIQDLFTVTLTHDLRNSLNIVKVGTQLMERRVHGGEMYVEVGTKINTAINRMDSMIQNLLDASRLRAGQSLNLEFEECYLNQLVQEVVEDLSLVYGQRFIIISDSDIITHCSHKEIRRVIENLAINAVKYGNSSRPITLSLQQTETQINLTVHNQGNAISPESQSILFQQFRRTISAETQKGWGLGLFLAKSIIEAHQGKLEVESSASKGTSFIITLPSESSRRLLIN